MSVCNYNDKFLHLLGLNCMNCKLGFVFIERKGVKIERLKLWDLNIAMTSNGYN
jgi:hypothetical protein